VNYEQVRGRAAASSEDRITRDAAGEEAQGMRLSRRCWDPDLCGCPSRGTIAAEPRWVFAAEGLFSSYGICGPRGRPLNFPLPLASLSTLLN